MKDVAQGLGKESFPGAEKYSQPSVATLEGAQTPSLSTQFPKHRCLHTTRQLLGFQLRPFIKPSMDSGLSAGKKKSHMQHQF